MDKVMMQGSAAPRRGRFAAPVGHFSLICILMMLLSPLASAGTSASDASFHLGRTPSQQHMAPAHRAYRNGFFGAAVRRFEKAAFWADKVAQYNIGIMHFQGQGVRTDRARAWAWLALSAERDYELMDATARAVWQVLDQADRERAISILTEELEPRFGDQVAVDRTARHMGLEFKKSTGSRIGNSTTMLYIRHTRGAASYNKETHSLHFFAENWDGPNFYDPVLWDFNRVLQAENWLFTEGPPGRVDLGDLRIIDDPDDQRIQ